MESIVARVARESTPSPLRRRMVQGVVRKVGAMLEAAASASGVRPRIEVGGSYAHGTWLEFQTDVDFFLAYPKEVERERFEELGLSLAEAALKTCSPRRRYAEHPYIEAEVDSVTVNAVPCYGVAKGEWKSAADRSPYHTRYMRDHLDGAMRSQVRVLKVFLRAQGLYGAEIRVKGFSGYACEVLTLKYGSFTELLRSAAAWERGIVISLEGGEDSARLLFRDAAFVLLDPVDVTRNLGQAVSPTKLGEFILLARSFLKRPDPGFFRSKQLTSRRSPPRYAKEHTLLLSFPFVDRSEDILWGELRKSANAVAGHLEKDGVHVVRLSMAAEGGRAALAFIVSPVRLPRVSQRDGPEVFMGNATERFLHASKGRADSWWMDDDLRSHTLVESAYATPAELLRGYMEDPVASVGFAKGLAGMAAKSYVVLPGVKAYTSRRPVDRRALADLAGYSF